MKQDQEKVRSALIETVMMLCKNGVAFESELTVQGLIGITIDRQDVFIVHLNERLGGCEEDHKGSHRQTDTETADGSLILHSSEEWSNQIWNRQVVEPSGQMTSGRTGRLHDCGLFRSLHAPRTACDSERLANRSAMLLQSTTTRQCDNDSDNDNENDDAQLALASHESLSSALEQSPAEDICAVVIKNETVDIDDEDNFESKERLIGVDPSDEFAEATRVDGVGEREPGTLTPFVPFSSAPSKRRITIDIEGHDIHPSTMDTSSLTEPPTSTKRRRSSQDSHHQPSDESNKSNQLQMECNRSLFTIEAYEAGCEDAKLKTHDDDIEPLIKWDPCVPRTATGATWNRPSLKRMHSDLQVSFSFFRHLLSVCRFLIVNFNLDPLS